MNWNDIVKHVLAVALVGASLYMAVMGMALPEWLAAGLGVVLGLYFPNSAMLFRILEVDWQEVTKYILAAGIVGVAIYLTAMGATLPAWLLAAVGAVLGTFFKSVALGMRKRLVGF